VRRVAGHRIRFVRRLEAGMSDECLLARFVESFGRFEELLTLESVPPELDGGTDSRRCVGGRRSYKSLVAGRRAVPFNSRLEFRHGCRCSC
jgi:hypothetical protein